MLFCVCYASSFLFKAIQLYFMPLFAIAPLKASVLINSIKNMLKNVHAVLVLHIKMELGTKNLFEYLLLDF